MRPRAGPLRREWAEGVPFLHATEMAAMSDLLMLALLAGIFFALYLLMGEADRW